MTDTTVDHGVDSTATPRTRTSPPTAMQATTLGEAVRAYVGRVRGGDMGSLPAILGLVVLFIVFGLANDRFLSALNMANLITQAGAIMVLAMGLVMVLLLGDIDLSAGVAGGVSACVMGLLIVKQDQPWYLAVLAALVTGAAIGFVIGVLVAKLGIPVVRGHARVLPRAAGRHAEADRPGRFGAGLRPGHRGISSDNLSVTGGLDPGWRRSSSATPRLSLLSHRRKVAKNLQHQPLAVVLLQIVRARRRAARS